MKAHIASVAAQAVACDMTASAPVATSMAVIVCGSRVGLAERIWLIVEYQCRRPPPSQAACYRRAERNITHAHTPAAEALDPAFPAFQRND